MKANVSFDHFRHQRIHRAAACGDVVQDIGAFRFLIERALDGLHLTSDSPHTVEQLFSFLRQCVRINLPF